MDRNKIEIKGVFKRFFYYTTIVQANRNFHKKQNKNTGKDYRQIHQFPNERILE